jgi:hypothetical protein
MLTFKEYLEEANLLGDKNPRKAIRIDPPLQKLKGERIYATASRGMRGSSSISRKGERPSWSQAKFGGARRNVSGTMTTTDRETVTNYLVPRGTNIITHKHPKTGQRHVTIVADTPEEKKRISSHKTRIREVPTSKTKKMPAGFDGERIMPRSDFDAYSKRGRQQTINNPIEHMTKSGMKVKFVSKKQALRHKSSLSKKGIDYSEET